MTDPEPAVSAAAPDDPKPETIHLLPSHGLDDLPDGLPEADAAGLLNAFALAWHPALLARSRALPRLARAAEPPRPAPHRRFVIAECVRRRLPDGWETDAGDSLAVIGPDRAAGLAAVEKLADRDRQGAGPLDAGLQVDAGLQGRLPDGRGLFGALGLGHLWVERLTRRTHYYSTLDETRLRVEAVAAADAWVAGDAAELAARLTEAAEVLREARERFYPTGAALLDLCFVLPRLADRLAPVLAGAAPSDGAGHPVNLLATGADWERIAADRPALIAAVRDAGDRVGLPGGEQTELAPALRDVTATLRDLTLGRETFGSLFGRQPGVWGRRRFGFTPLAPQLAGAFGYAGALHLNFGDGESPAGGRGRVRWAGADGEIPAHARDPRPAESAAAWWDLPDAFADAFEQEQTVAVTFARWPGAPGEPTTAPLLDDLKALTALSPVLGEFRTYEQVFAEDDPFARLLAADPRKYRTRELEAAVAAGTAGPISSHTGAVQTDAADRVAGIYDGLAGLLASGGRRPPEPSEHARDPARALAAALTRGGAGIGTLHLNPLPVPRVAGVESPAAPADHPAVRVVGKSAFTLELPPCGFVWLPNGPAATAPVTTSKAKTAEPGVVRNEFFEVRLSEATGGVAAVKTYGRSPNRLALVPAVRFGSRRSGPDGEPTLYSRAVRTDWEILDAGPARGAVRSRGELRDPAGGAVLARFSLRVELYRGTRTARVSVELRDVAAAPTGSPYADNLCLRWAWDDEAAELARSIQGTRQAAPAAGTFEAPHYFELTELSGDGKLRTAVLTGGLPFHVRRGPRMADTPLLVVGESSSGESGDAPRSWDLGIAVDDPHPMRAADAFLSPPAAVVGVPRPASGPTGWLLACDCPGVRVLQIAPRADGSAVVRLQETDGRTREATLRFFKPPAAATRRTVGGADAGPLACGGDAVRVPLAGYELCDAAVRF